jgi:DNA-binding transcriptional LysR family regulator
MESLTDLAVFARVVDLGGFSAAARDLGISKAAASKRVARLEDRLQARLLNRTTRRVSPTAVGRAFHDRCLRILAEVDEAERAVTALQVEPKGRLRVAAPVSFGILHLGPAIADFMTTYPDVDVTLDLNDRFVDVIEEGYDVAIRIGVLDESSLIARRLAPFRRHLVAAPAYWQAAGVPETAEDFAAHRCLVYSLLAQPDRWALVDRDGGAHEVRICAAMRCNNGDIIKSALIAGAGIAVQPAFIVGQAMADGALQECPTFRPAERAGAGIFALYPHTRHLSATVRAFVDHMAAAFAGPEPGAGGGG